MVFRRWMLVIGACLLLLLSLAGYKFVQIRQMIAFAESFPEASETVEVFTVTPTRWQTTTQTIGEVLAPQALTLRNEVEGRIIAVGFVAGEPVKKDQMLLQLDASEEIARLRAAQADAHLAQLALARYEKLMTQNVTSREQYDQARAQYAMATANAQALQAIIDKKTLTAPFDGTAGLHTLQPGQYLAADTLITQLVGDQQMLWIDFSMPQQLSGIGIGTDVSVSAHSVLPTPVTGRVIAGEPVVSRESRNIRFRAAIDNRQQGITPKPGILKPGMLVDVQVATAPAREVFAVPATAIQYDKTGAYVFVITLDDKQQPRAHKRSVTLGAEAGGSTVVESGLSTGERIAANGAYKLQDGMLAHVHTDTPAPAESSSP